MLSIFKLADLITSRKWHSLLLFAATCATTSSLCIGVKYLKACFGAHPFSVGSEVVLRAIESEIEKTDAFKSTVISKK